MLLSLIKEANFIIFLLILSKVLLISSSVLVLVSLNLKTFGSESSRLFLFTLGVL